MNRLERREIALSTPQPCQDYCGIRLGDAGLDGIWCSLHRHYIDASFK